MPRFLDVPPTGEPRAFIAENSDDGTLYATPSGLVRAPIRARTEREEAADRWRFRGHPDLAWRWLFHPAGDRSSSATDPANRPRTKVGFIAEPTEPSTAGQINQEVLQADDHCAFLIPKGKPLTATLRPSS